MILNYLTIIIAKVAKDNVQRPANNGRDKETNQCSRVYPAPKPHARMYRKLVMFVKCAERSSAKATCAVNRVKYKSQAIIPPR